MRALQFHRYTTNYGGPLRASDAMAKGASFQLFAMVLVNICYRLYAEADFAGHHGGIAVAAPHAFRDAFNRRLESGQWFYTPCLGWKEFAPDYVGPFRPETGLRNGEPRNAHDASHGFRPDAEGHSEADVLQQAQSRNLRVEKGVLIYA